MNRQDDDDDFNFVLHVQCQDDELVLDETNRWNILQWTYLQLISFAIAHVVLLVILLLKYDVGEQLQMSPL